MAEILIAACPPIGHVGPLLSVARGLVDRGDRVTFLTAERHAPKIFAVGAHPHPLPPAADYDDTSFDADLPGRSETSGIARLNFDITHLFVHPMRHQAQALSNLLTERRYDAIIVDAIFLGVLPMLLGDNADRPPVLSYSTTPLFLSSRDTAPGGTGITPGRGPLAAARNRLLNLVGRHGLLRPSHAAANAALRTLGAPKLPVFVLDSGVLADRLIAPTVPEFEYRRSDQPDHVRFVGAVVPAPTEHFDPPPWWNVLNSGRPVVHVTQGTIDNADLTRLIEPTIAALADEDVTVVVTTGGRDVGRIGIPLPANTFVAEYLPHDVLLPLVDVMVTNGGYGAVQRALMDGVPLVVAGNTEDKPEVAARVEWFGVGINLRTGTPSVGAVRRAVRDVLTDNGFRDAAWRIQVAYAQRDGVAEIACLVDDVIAERHAQVSRA
jgi:MGT family glycosyltransferase